MSEYFIVANSFPAPFCSDESRGFIEAQSPREALEKYAAQYNHPCGLYAAVCYTDANAEAKNAAPLAKWLCNREAEKARITKDLPGYSYLGKSATSFEVNGVEYTVENPKGGRVVEAQ